MLGLGEQDVVPFGHRPGRSKPNAFEQPIDLFKARRTKRPVHMGLVEDPQTQQTNQTIPSAKSLLEFAPSAFAVKRLSVSLASPSTGNEIGELRLISSLPWS